MTGELVFKAWPFPRSEHAGAFPRDPQWDRALWLAARYEVACEDFDRGRCKMRDRAGMAIVATHEERRDVDQNAVRENRLMKQAADGIPDDVLRRARRRAVDMGYTACAEVVRRGDPSVRRRENDDAVDYDAWLEGRGR